MWHFGLLSVQVVQGQCTSGSRTPHRGLALYSTFDHIGPRIKCSARRGGDRATGPGKGAMHCGLGTFHRGCIPVLRLSHSEMHRLDAEGSAAFPGPRGRRPPEGDVHCALTKCRDRMGPQGGTPCVKLCIGPAAIHSLTALAFVRSGLQALAALS
jgi:hypothetical protein